MFEIWVFLLVGNVKIWDILNFFFLVNPFKDIFVDRRSRGEVFECSKESKVSIFSLSR